MSKNAQTKRKAKQTTQRTQTVQQAQMRATRIAAALMDVCMPFEDEFFKTREILGPNDWFSLWRAGCFAWNLEIRGHKVLFDALLDKFTNDAEERALLLGNRETVSEMIRRKSERYPQFRTEIKKVAAAPEGDRTRLKVTLGETRSRIQSSEDKENNQNESAPEDIPAESPEMKQTLSAEKTLDLTSRPNNRKIACLQKKEDGGNGKHDDLQEKEDGGNGKHDDLQKKEDGGGMTDRSDIEARLEEFDLLANDTQARLKEIVSLLESRKVPSVEETNALDRNLETLRAKYDSFVSLAGKLLLEEEMPPEGSGLEQYRTAIENSSAVMIRQKMEDARKTLERFTRIRGRVIAFSNALKPYQDTAAELLKSISEDSIDDILSDTIAPKLFLDAIDAEDINSSEGFALLEEVSKYYPNQVQWGLAGKQYYEDTSIPPDRPADSTPSASEEPEAPQEPESAIEVVEAPPADDSNTAETTSGGSDSQGKAESVSDDIISEVESTDAPAAVEERKSEPSSEQQGSVSETEAESPVEEETVDAEASTAEPAPVEDETVDTEASTAESAPVEEETVDTEASTAEPAPEEDSDETDDSDASAGEEIPSGDKTEPKPPEEDVSAEDTSTDETDEAAPSDDIDFRSFLERRDTPSDEEFCCLISKVLNQPPTTPKQVNSVIVQSVLLANGAELVSDRPGASKYSAQLKLATHLLLEESPYSSESLNFVFPDSQNENKALLLSAYLFAMLNPSVSHDNTLWTQAKSYFSDYDSLFESFGAFKPLFNKLMSVKDFETGFSPIVIASLGSAAEIEASLNKLKNEAKNYLEPQIPKTQIKALPAFYRTCFGKGSALHHCMNILIESKNDEKSIETVEKTLATYCDRHDDSFTINSDKVDGVLDTEWEKVTGKNTFRLEYKARVQAIRQFSLRLELMLSWIEQMNYANKKEHLSRLRELRKKIIETCDAIQKDGSWKKESYAIVLSWLLTYMKGYLKGEISDLDIYSDLLLTGAISVNEDGTPIMDPNMAKIHYFEPWRNALRHILAERKKIEEVKAEILGSAMESSDDNDGLKDNLHQLEMLGKHLRSKDDDYVATASQLSAAINYAERNIVEFKEKIELAYTYGKINENEKDLLYKTMELYRSTFYDLKDFATWRRFLDALTKQINEYAEGRMVGLREKISQRLETNPESRILLEANRLLEEEQNIAVAEEYLNRFDAGQTNLDDVNLLLHESKYYKEFQENENALLQECKKDRRLWKMDGGPADFDRIKDCWPSRKLNTSGEQIVALLECLGFTVKGIMPRQVMPNNEEVFRISVEATPKSTADYLHPIAAFGTQLKSPLNVIVLHTNYTPKQLVDAISSINLRSLSIVLINRTIDAANRRLVGELFHTTTSGQNPFLLVDLVLFLFLARHQIYERLPALLNCTLPYTTYQPFVCDGGSIPDEMFFGRTQELNTIIDLNGPCVVYGGRQLGKTALLERVESLRSMTKDKRFAVYSNIVNRREEKDVVSTLVCDIKRKSDGKIDLNECETLVDLCKQLSRLFKNETIVTMHLLIDEVDAFLGAIADQAYKPLQPLVDLRRETRNNFKFVIAGLHNVCRAKNATRENGLFGQLGTPLCIKPLSPMDALNLLSRPLSYLGFQIERNRLETILTNTNSYPGIIQFFGYMLVQTLTELYQKKYFRASAGNPPFTLRDDQLGSVMNSADLNKSIKDKIRLTLELDPRYFMIARCITLLHYYHEGTYGDLYGFKLNEIIEIASTYKIHCLEKETPEEYENLLAEMEEMGMLCQSDGMYRLRKASFVDIIGESIDVLEQEIEQNNFEV